MSTRQSAPLPAPWEAAIQRLIGKVARLQVQRDQARLEHQRVRVAGQSDNKQKLALNRANQELDQAQQELTAARNQARARLLQARPARAALEAAQQADLSNGKIEAVLFDSPLASRHPRIQTHLNLQCARHVAGHRLTKACEQVENQGTGQHELLAILVDFELAEQALRDWEQARNQRMARDPKVASRLAAHRAAAQMAKPATSDQVTPTS